MFWRKWMLVGIAGVMLSGLYLPPMTHAQTDWTCDDGEQDVLNAAQAAFDAGDFARAAELAGIGVTVCTNDIRRLQEALGLQELAERAAAEAEIIASTEPGLVDLGDYALFMRCEGERANPTDPIVIFENGGGAVDMHTWDHVAWEVATAAQVCTYDRRGIGHSDPVPTDIFRTTGDIADDLHALLEAAGLEGPYVLVGHSSAGLHIRMFYSRYGEDVVGIVLVDVTHPDFNVRMAEVDPSFLNNVPARGSGPERLDFAVSAELVRETGNFGDTPLIVLTAEFSAPANLQPVWLELQAEIAALSTQSEQRIVERTGHFIQNEEPEVIIEAILDMLALVDAAD